MKTPMLPKFLLPLLGLPLALSPLSADPISVATDPVGYVTLSLEEDGRSLVGIPLVNNILFQGSISSVSQSGLVVSSGNLIDVLTDSNNEKYYLEILTGDSLGVLSDILSVESNTEVITGDDLTAHLAEGDMIAIRQHNTLSSLFGAANESQFVSGGNSALDPNSDRLIVDGIFYYYKSGGIGGTGWRTASNADASNAVVWPTSAITVVRNNDTFREAVFVGSVKTTPTVFIRQSGRTPVSTLYPVGRTFGESGLFDSSSSFSISGGNSALDPNADRILMGGVFYYYKSGGIGGTGWRTASNLDATNVIIDDSFILISNQSPSNIRINNQ